ncbi:MAG: hypothetical protein GXY02_10470 [Actinobacteria bacterium]|nr:hypothetical protein [Actinomycetota bacterium]
MRQSGSGPTRHGRLSKQDSAAARHVLVEAAWPAAAAPGPLHAFATGIAGRRGRQVAVACKPSALSWFVLTRGEDYAFVRPSLVRYKLRTLELASGADRSPTSPGTEAATLPSGASGSRPSVPTSGSWRIRQRVVQQWTRVLYRVRILVDPRKARPHGRSRAPDACTSRASVARAEKRAWYRRPRASRR